jgi:hypothetical protein
MSQALAGQGHNDLPESPELSWLDKRRMISLKEAARLRGVSEDTLRRQAARGEIEIVQLSPRRVGMRLGDALTL